MSDNKRPPDDEHKEIVTNLHNERVKNYMEKPRKKTEVSALLRDLEGVLHNAIEMNLTGNLNVYEMVAVAATTLLEQRQRGSIEKKPKSKIIKRSTPVDPNAPPVDNVIPFRGRTPTDGQS